MISVGENFRMAMPCVNFRIISNKIPEEIQDAFTGVAKALQIYQNSTGLFALPRCFASGRHHPPYLK